MRILPVFVGASSGAALGFLLGPPAFALFGAVAGGAASALSPWARSRHGDPRVAGIDLGEVRDIPVSLRCEYHESGVRLTFDFPRSLRQDALLEVRLWDRWRERWVPGRAPFNADGGIRRRSKVILGQAVVYLPCDALVYDRSGSFDVYLSFFHETALGESRLFDQRLPCELMLGLPGKGSSWSYGLHLRPLVDLLMAIARADGSPTPEKTGVVLRALQRFEPSTETFAELRTYMRADPHRPFELTSRQVRFAFPEYPLVHIFDWLVEIAKADGAVTTRSQELLELFASACNVAKLELDDWLTSRDARASVSKRRTTPPESSSGQRAASDRWSARARAAPPKSATLPIAPPAPKVKSPWEVLEVAETATEEEIQSAYRKKVAQYHPDRVAHLPSEFQDLAHHKLLELNGAREQIKLLALCT